MTDTEQNCSPCGAITSGLARRRFFEVSAAMASSVLWLKTPTHSETTEIEPFLGPILCGLTDGAQPAIARQTCAHERSVRPRQIYSAGEIPSWKYNRLHHANFSDDWTTLELRNRLAPQVSLLSEFFRVSPVIKRAAGGGMGAIPAWWPGKPTPGLIVIGGDHFAEMQLELPDDPLTGGWRVTALFALAHEFVHSACFGYANSIRHLRQFPHCFFELTADLCAGAFVEHLVSVLGYNRLDTDSIVSYFEARSSSGGDTPIRSDWHGSSRMRLEAIALGRNMIKESPQLSGLAILRRGISSVIKTFDTPDLRQSFDCAGIFWGFPELQEAAIWLAQEKRK